MLKKGIHKTFITCQLHKNISSAGTLVVSFIGLETQEVKIQPVMKVVLHSNNEMLDEVVVVAYGTASKQSLTGSVASIDAKELELRPVTSATSALEGTAPGIQVNSSYGEPGSNKTQIRIRGFGSVNGTNEPLIVVDGVPYNGDITDINSDDIESMSVLKDAASAALYGNKAANGVILITTKRGKDSKLNVRVNVKQGIYNRAIPEYDHMGINDWMETMRLGYKRYFMVDKGMDAASASAAASAGLSSIVKTKIFDREGAEWFDTNGKFVAKVLPGYTDLDWLDALQRTGYRQEYGISTDAGNEKYDMFASFSYLNEKGYIISSDFDRFTARLKTNFKPTTWFKAGINLAATMSSSNYADSAESNYFINPFYTAGLMGPVYPYYQHNADGSLILDENGNPQYDVANYDYLDGRNIIYELQNDINRKDRNSITGQVYATVNFLKDFSFTTKGDLYVADLYTKNFNNPVCGDGAANGGRLSQTADKSREYRFTQELYWTHDFNLHHVDVLAAHESFKYSFNTNYFMKEAQKIAGGNTEASNFSKVTYAEGYADEFTTESYLARARYNYNQRYYVDASFRRDGSSRFYHPWGNFWSLGASWMISEEKFMKGIDWINSLKLRASYGEVGNDAGVDYYAYKSLYSSDTNSGMGAYYKTQNANQDLKWETSSSFDIALEGRLFERLNFSIDFFNKKSKDLLFNVYNPLSAGATGWPWNADGTAGTGMSSIYKNIGSVRNTGVEIALDVDAIRTKDWRWNIGLNLTSLHNEITKLPDGKDILNGVQNFSEGHSIYEFYTYTYAGVDQLTGRSLFNADPEKVTDALRASGDVVTINGKDYVYNTSYAKKDWQGSALPKVYGSINTSLTWKDLTLSVLCTYSLGGKVYDYNYSNIMSTSTASPQALHPDLLNAWKEAPAGMTEDSPNRIDPNGIPAFDLSSYDAFSQGAGSRWLTSASYFAIKNINVGYNIPKSLIKNLGISGLKLFGTVENAVLFTSRKGLNPQYSFNGTQDNTFVSARIFTFGLNLTF
ncbi:SusC/RagA family TonB-linked outer membrane protein [uncultured Phocaeicola sp.]|uniref:SusC/RagA family TonB-linked outer membrane protein n=1 Tax=uncultured Phocaeicola sp. TaxID=990718 RepID=UPI0025EEC71C|nr:SusC/RagA family TonB-linked outer membrane protein [uncultured Phocaeicola sp.]